MSSRRPAHRAVSPRLARAYGRVAAVDIPNPWAYGHRQMWEKSLLAAIERSGKRGGGGGGGERVGELEQQLRDARAAQQAAEADTRRAQQGAAARVAALKAAKADAAKLQSERDSLQSRLTSTEDALRVATSETRTRDWLEGELRRSKSEADSRVAAAEQAARDALDDASNARVFARQRQFEVDRLVAALNAATAKNSDEALEAAQQAAAVEAAQQRVALEERVSSLESESVSLRKELEGARQGLRERASEVAAARAEVATLKTQAAADATATENDENRLRAAIARAVASERELRQARESLRTLQGTLEAVQQEQTTTADELRKQSAAARKAVTDNATLLADVESRLLAANARAEAAEAELQQLQADFDAQDAAVLAALSRVERAEADNAELQQVLSSESESSTAERSQQVSELARARAQATVSEQELDATKADLARTREQLERVNVTLRQQRGSIEDAESNAAEAAAKLLAAENDVTLKDAELAELKRQLSATREQLASARLREAATVLLEEDNNADGNGAFTVTGPTVRQASSAEGGASGGGDDDGGPTRLEVEEAQRKFLAEQEGEVRRQDAADDAQDEADSVFGTQRDFVQARERQLEEESSDEEGSFEDAVEF